MVGFYYFVGFKIFWKFAFTAIYIAENNSFLGKG